MKTNAFYKTLLALAVVVGLASCSDDDNGPINDGAKYNTEVHITDAPIDNAEIKGVFVTIADVKVDGKSISGFSKTTVDLMALRNGNTQQLGQIDLSAGSYNQLSLVLDQETDANGNAPANYVLKINGEKVALNTDNSTLATTQDFEINASANNKLVIDFDLRKAIVSEGSEYNFAAAAQLQNSIRVVNAENTGKITGAATNNTGRENQKVVAYAYTKGSYNATETQENASGVRFANAVTSSVATGNDNNFGLYFLNEGNYEVHFASYEDPDDDGVFEFAGMIETEGLLNINLMDISVMANTQVTLEIILLNLIGL